MNLTLPKKQNPFYMPQIGYVLGVLAMINTNTCDCDTRHQCLRLFPDGILLLRVFYLCFAKFALGQTRAYRTHRVRLIQFSRMVNTVNALARCNFCRALMLQTMIAAHLILHSVREKFQIVFGVRGTMFGM